MKKLMIAILSFVILLSGCGNTGISKEEYDKVVAERDVLKAESENAKKVLELCTLANGYSEKIKAEYEHAVFVFFVSEKVSDTDSGEAEQAIKELRDVSLNTIDSVIRTYETTGSLTEMDENSYDAAMKAIDAANEEWDKAYSAVMDVEKMITGGE